MAYRSVGRKREWKKPKNVKRITDNAKSKEGAGVREERRTVNEGNRQSAPVALCDKDIM